MATKDNMILKDTQIELSKEDTEKAIAFFFREYSAGVKVADEQHILVGLREDGTGATLYISPAPKPEGEKE